MGRDGQWPCAPPEEPGDGYGPETVAGVAEVERRCGVDVATGNRGDVQTGHHPAKAGIRAGAGGD